MSSADGTHHLGGLSRFRFDSNRKNYGLALKRNNHLRVQGSPTVLRTTGGCRCTYGTSFRQALGKGQVESVMEEWVDPA